MWQGSQYLNFDVQSGYHTWEEDFGLSFNAAVNSSLQDLNAIRIYVDHNYGTNSFNTSVLLQVIVSFPRRAPVLSRSKRRFQHVERLPQNFFLYSFSKNAVLSILTVPINIFGIKKNLSNFSHGGGGWWEGGVASSLCYGSAPANLRAP